MEDIILDPTALANLKHQVENRLSLSKSGKNQSAKQKPHKKALDSAETRKRSSNGKIKNGSKQTDATTLVVNPQATIKDVEPVKEQNGKRSPTSTKQVAGSSKTAPTKASSLKDDVLALGGDEKDLELIQDIDSDSEMETSTATSTDKSLQRELAKLMKGLPFKEAKQAFSDELIEDEEEPGDVEDGSEPLIAGPQTISTGTLIVEPQSEWFKIKLAALPASGGGKLPEKTIRDLLDHGKDLLKRENKAYTDVNMTSSSFKFYKEMMTSGTLTDKISALTLSVQESPLHNQQSLEALVALAKKRSRSQAVQVLGALKDLFGAGALLPSDRRLNHFASQRGLSQLSLSVFQSWHRGEPLPQPLLKEHVLLWAYEDWLKSTYFEVIKVLEIWSNDEIIYSRLRSIDYVFDLLKEKPEQEANLLHLLVNKLGDPEKQVASRVSSHLVQLQIPHPFMKAIIISSVEADILFKPGETWHAKYYAIITLNQTILSSGQQEVVHKLLDIYFSMFLSLLGNHSTIEKVEDKGKHSGEKATKDGKRTESVNKSKKPTVSDAELKEKVTSGILSGINRAYPYATNDEGFFEKRLDTLFKITHSSNFNTSIQALMLLQQLCTSHPAASDRFYRTLYESLLDARLLTTSKHALYINLLYRSMKSDTNIKRVQAFVKRLGQIISMHQPSFVCAIIYLIKDLEETFPSLHSLIDQPEAYDSDEDGDSSRIQTQAYDGKKRDPQFSNADRCCIWELQPLAVHFHPSVSLFVSKLLAKQKIESKPDLSLHTLINFLDRFVYRNPKKITDAMKGVSLMQPMAIAKTSDMLISGRASDKRKGPALNTVDFARMSNDKVRPDEVFFHKYFSVREQNKDIAQKKKEKRRKNAEVESDEEGDPENEDQIWKALVDSRPELGDDGSDGFDDDDGFSDLESLGAEDSADDGAVSDDGDLDLDDEEEDAFFDSDQELDALDSADGGETLAAVPGPDDIGNLRGGKKRKLLKELPTFASAEDYATILQNEQDGL